MFLPIRLFIPSVLLLVVILAGAADSPTQDPRIQTTVSASPSPTVTLSFGYDASQVPANTTITHELHRRIIGTKAWELRDTRTETSHPYSVAPRTYEHPDSVDPIKIYEYRLTRTISPAMISPAMGVGVSSVAGFVTASVRGYWPANRGKVILLVDDGYIED